MEIFTELDHRLSVVKRWGILHTIQTQSVAEHAFNVQRIALRIATLWFKIHDVERLYSITRWALEHDDLEAISGDLPTMVKPYFDEEAMAKEHADLGAGSILVVDEFDQKIVKLADRMEGFHFLAIETALGNNYVQNHYVQYFREIDSYVVDNFTNNIRHEVRDWMQNMHKDGLKSTRYSKRGR